MLPSPFLFRLETLRRDLRLVRAESEPLSTPPFDRDGIESRHVLMYTRARQEIEGCYCFAVLRSNSQGRAVEAALLMFFAAAAGARVVTTNPGCGGRSFWQWLDLVDWLSGLGFSGIRWEMWDCGGF